MAELRREGASPFDCMRAIQVTEGVGLATAKRLFFESSSWADVVGSTIDDFVHELESSGSATANELTEGGTEHLLRILKIGHDTSSRGVGLSLREALRQTRYRELRAGFQESDLLALVKANPSVVEEWLAYSEDKRTSGGWYVLRDGQVGQVDVPAALIQFPSLEEAIAGYVVRELDSGPT